MVVCLLAGVTGKDNLIIRKMHFTSMKSCAIKPIKRISWCEVGLGNLQWFEWSVFLLGIHVFQVKRSFERVLFKSKETSLHCRDQQDSR